MGFPGGARKRKGSWGRPGKAAVPLFPLERVVIGIFGIDQERLYFRFQLMEFPREDGLHEEMHEGQLAEEKTEFQFPFPFFGEGGQAVFFP